MEKQNRLSIIKKSVRDREFQEKATEDILILSLGIFIMLVPSCQTPEQQKQTYDFVEHLIKICFEGIAGTMTAGTIIYRLYLQYKNHKKNQDE